jgi:hypothetical protein
MDDVSKTVERLDAGTVDKKGNCVFGTHEIVESEKTI